MGFKPTMTENRPEPRTSVDLSVAQIEQLVEAQARGEAAVLGGTHVEDGSLPQAELDMRYSRQSLAATALLGTSTGGHATDTQPGKEDAASDGTPLDAPASSSVQSAEDGNASPGVQDADPSRTAVADPVITTDDGLGLIFRRNEG
jgi:hypothetical protein